MQSNKDKAIKTTYLSIGGNLLLALLKGITGLLGNSYALIADAIESLTDVFSSLLVLVGLHYSTKPPDEDHPYGHGKAEPLTTFAVVGFLMVSATLIAYQSIMNLQRPQESPASFTLIILGIIILVKEGFYRIVLRRSKEIKSTSLRADAWHHRSDAITSLIAFAGILIAVWFGDEYAKADDFAALVASVFILFNAWLIFRPALSEIMDEQVHEDIIHSIREVSSGVAGIVDTEKCFVRKSGLSYHVDLHAVVDGTISVSEGHALAHKLKATLMENFPEITDVLIHVEPYMEKTNKK